MSKDRMLARSRARSQDTLGWLANQAARRETISADASVQVALGEIVVDDAIQVRVAGLVVTVIVGVKMLGFEIVPPPSMTDQVVALTV